MDTERGVSPRGDPGAVRPGPTFAGLGVRTVLVVAFLLTAGIWVFAGSFFAGRVREVERQAAEVGGRYMEAQALLSDTRGELYRASIFVRDALLDPAPDADQYRRELEAAYRSADDLLGRYQPVMNSSSERERVNRLRLEIAALRDANLGVLSTDSARWRAEAGRFLEERIIPKREAAIQVANELQDLNRDAYINQQAESAELYRNIQERFQRIFGVTVVLTLGIALLSAFHLTRLERRLRQEQEKDARTAVELHQLSAKLVTAQEEERRSIARDLHDEIGQVLTVIKMELSHAQRLMSSGGADPTLLDDARSITDRALQAVRDISHLLHPPLLDDLGLSAAVDWYVQNINRRHEIKVEFASENMAVRLPGEIEVAVYRIVQEALTNVLRHARARRCEVTLRRSPSSVTVMVRDDGVGFHLETRSRAGRAHGLGLIGVRERVSQLDGTLRLESTPGGGTVLSAVFPLREEVLPPVLGGDEDVAPSAARVNL